MLRNLTLVAAIAAVTLGAAAAGTGGVGSRQEEVVANVGRDRIWEDQKSLPATFARPPWIRSHHAAS